MRRFLLRRMVLTGPVLLGAVTLVFLLLHALPAEALLDRILGETAPAEQREALRGQLLLDRSLPEQYTAFLVQALRGDLGSSLEHRRPVTQLLAERFPATLLLAGAAAFLAVALAVPAGVAAAAAPGRWPDRAATLLSVGGLSIPNIWLGPLLILLFAVRLDWFPVSGMSGVGSVVLPAVTLGAAMAAHLARMVRGALLEEAAADYARVARAKGLSGAGTLWRHLLPNALTPAVTVLALQLGSLLTGSIVTETIFGWPGLGQLLLRAIGFRDLPLIQGCVLAIALSYLAMNLVADLAYAALDPRVRLR